MEHYASLLGICAALTVGVISPGPSFVMIARTAVAASRNEGVAAAIGMGCGGVLFAIAALLGLQGLLLAVPLLYTVLKVAGGIYLAFLGFKIWRGASLPLQIAAATGNLTGRNSLSKSLILGFTTQVSNPKTSIVYASVFAAFMPGSQSISFDVLLICTVFVIESSWYAIVAVALSSARPRTTYLRYKHWLDRVAGGVMMALGIKLVASAR
ncbi:LysE family translocator [Undibacterium sp. TS12]|uniref:LysE family translocator n=1 Tax=Undibacterium sp. TS12 TaxID=2908202 RepID=UPI001F4C594B|nr:LysE family translocator [Undibacterium sp. TS12]MCH8617523.1 LysE family translocator [Undibacterium sp. TS12]